MSAATADAERAVRAALLRDEPLRIDLDGGGRVHMDRPLPFLCVHRQRAGSGDDLARHLIEGESAYIVAPAGTGVDDTAARLASIVADSVAPRFGGFLVVEVWPADEHARPDRAADAPGVRRPMFRILAESLPADDGTVRTLYRELAAIPLRPTRLEVEIVAPATPRPHGMTPLLDDATAARHNAHTIGIEVQPVYRQARTRLAYPELLRTVADGMVRALRRTFHHFQQAHTSLGAPHHHALGRRSVLDEAWQADQQLADVVAGFDFLLKVTPLNTARARAAFERAGWKGSPVFDYRPLAVDVAVLKRTLHSIRMERLEDPTLAWVLEETRDEVDRKLTMLADRDTPRFLHGSLQVYGEVDDELVAHAGRVLELLPPAARDDDGDALDADAFAARARTELDAYRARDPGLAATVDIRGDVTGLVVSRGNLLVGSDARIPARRVSALLHHEIGTHVLTAHNGAAQPLRQLATGLAGYEETQEGLAVVAEYLAGGLSAARLRLLAARVIAARSVAERATFEETHRALVTDHGFSGAAAFGIAMRVHRSGGFTKDAIYLRGLVALLEHLGSGGAIEPLLVGKIRLAHIPAVEELLWRKVLQPARLTPNYLTEPTSADRMHALRRGLDLCDIARELAA